MSATTHYTPIDARDELLADVFHAVAVLLDQTGKYTFPEQSAAWLVMRRLEDHVDTVAQLRAERDQALERHRRYPELYPPPLPTQRRGDG